jgi:hypothetical protein
MTILKEPEITAGLPATLKALRCPSPGLPRRRYPGCEYLAVLIAAYLSVFLNTGCSSTGKSDSGGGFVSAVVHANSREQVRDTTARVFREHGYQVVQNGYAKLVVEKVGTTMERIAYGSLMEGGAWIRVKISLYDVSSDTFRLECQAYAVRGKGEVLEEETKLTSLSRGKYKDLMNEIAKRLGDKPAASS